ncbi:MAG: prohibitin family protein [Saprospiraceae bacterium]|nr:prohibitin family protein [Candidatus Vicinibacter affinis]HQX44072.1 prohibitin family protein [Saprospiraceae bacterium]MBK6822787.1 prohibitin family protein [Candidatus Vicinibacter affinis]MBK7304887.1 prohibitin family protein [Candidatus Vicinibacter affinis]MBK7799701.1 prohibitin family protein [Candidatus Vicinibacter affinis]
MILIVIGILGLGVQFFLNQENQHPSIRKLSKIFRVAAFVLILVGVFSSCFIQINAGQIGVKSLFGKVQQDILYPGLHVVNPLLVIHEMDVRTQNYTMSGVTDEGNVKGDDAIRALTKDGLEIVIDVTVLYKVLPTSAPKIYNEIGKDYQDKVIRPLARSRIRDFSVGYEAIELYSSKRDEFQMKIFKTVEEDFLARGLILEQLLIRNISLPTSIKASIEEKIRAEQESQKMQFVLMKEKQEAERKRVEAQGIADYQRIINTGLTDKQLEYELIKAYKELSLSQNAKVIVLNGKNTPLMLNGN